MKFAVHTKATETTPETRLIVPNDTDKPAEEFFPEEDHATAALLEALRRGDLPGTFHDYAVTPYDDKGNELARVDKADRDAAASDAQWLMSNDKQCLVAVSTMIASRQLYALVVNELERHLNAIKTTNGENRPPHPVTIDALLQAAGHAAAQPFNELDLFQGLTDTVFPWLKEVTSEHATAEREAKEAARAAAEVKRQANPVSIGITVYDKQSPPSLVRDRPVVLVGYAPALQYVLDTAMTAAIATVSEDQPTHKFNVLRFSSQAKPAVGNKQLLCVGSSAWKFDARSKQEFKQRLGILFSEQIMPAMRAMDGDIDLLIIDDLMPMIAKIAPGIDTYKAGTVLRWLTEWAKHVGMGLIAGLPHAGEKPMRVDGTEWEGVRTKGVLRPISVGPVEQGQRKLTIGLDAWSADVSADLLQPANRIIMP